MKPLVKTSAAASAAAANEKAKAERTKLGVAGATGVRLNRLAARLDKQLKGISGWAYTDDDGEDQANVANAALKIAVISLRSAATALATFPKDFAPKGKRGPRTNGGGSLAVGATVTIREKALSKYADAFTNGEGKTLTVERVGGLCVCRTTGGDRVFLKRGDLVLVTPAAAE